MRKYLILIALLAAASAVVLLADEVQSDCIDVGEVTDDSMNYLGVGA